MTRRRNRSSRGTLIVVTLFLLSSAAIRIGNGAGQAIARQADPEEAPASAEPSQCETAESLAPLIDLFKEREQKLLTAEKAMSEKQKLLEQVEGEVTAKLAALESAEQSLRDTIALAETAAEDDLSQLTQVYEAMKPKEAAELFEAMAPEFAAGFLGRMSPERAAGVLAGLSPEAAYSISVILAARNVGAPTE
ncbi:MotE family protein [Shimia biformata]|uniref:MotE family protein n=1 Tax=Shimia biformata TaxID=1294299 RepID=UPI00194F8BA9|nr:hypothetical protein [Shimia biformata]